MVAVSVIVSNQKKDVILLALKVHACLYLAHRPEASMWKVGCFGGLQPSTILE